MGLSGRAHVKFHVPQEKKIAERNNMITYNLVETMRAAWFKNYFQELRT